MRLRETMTFFVRLFLAFAALVSLGFVRQQSVLASEFAASLTKATGICLYLDPRADSHRVTVTSDAKLTARNFEDHVQRLVKALPHGSTWAKLYLPAAPKDKVWKPADVIAYARAQANLYGTVGATEPGTVEILSQKLDSDKAKPVIEALNLKLVYIVVLGCGTFNGTWNTTYGQMRLTVTGQRVTGTYTSGDGVIEGTVAGDIMRFRWLERGSGRGGPGAFTLSEDGNSFTGRWGYDDVDQEPDPWTGTRVSHTP